MTFFCTGSALVRGHKPKQADSFSENKETDSSFVGGNVNQKFKQLSLKCTSYHAIKRNTNTLIEKLSFVAKGEG